MVLIEPKNEQESPYLDWALILMRLQIIILPSFVQFVLQDLLKAKFKREIQQRLLHNRNVSVKPELIQDIQTLALDVVLT